MRTTKRLLLLALLTAGLSLASALAFDGTHAPSKLAPAASVELVVRTPVAGSPVELSPADGTTVKRALTAVEAFRSGAQALRAGDTKTGLSSLEYAAERGHPIAQWKLGRMYADGEYVRQDDLRAFEYFRHIAEVYADESPGTLQARFVANAFVALGNYYLEGIPNSPIKADPNRARERFAYAASYFGDPDAQYHLGRMYLEGIGGVKDVRQAVRWLKLAANKRQYKAQALLGATLFEGKLVPRQAATGLMWLTIARDAAPQEKWIADLHAAASAQATDEERALALIMLAQWMRGQRE